MGNRRTRRDVDARLNSRASTVETLERRLLLAGHMVFFGGGWQGVGIKPADKAPPVTAPPASDFDGTTVDAGVFFRITRHGDYALNGVVNLADFNRLAADFGSTWPIRDFSYDGIVNLADFNRLAAAFGLTAGADGPTGSDWEALVRAASIFENAAVSRGGTLTLLGTKFADTIIVDSERLASIQSRFPKHPIKRIHIDAGAGNDHVEIRVSLPSTLIGARGDDTLIGGPRADYISGGEGNDSISGGSGDDTLAGLAGNDTLLGGPGADLLLGGDGDDMLFGGSGDDTLRSGRGTDNLFGDDGNDLLYGEGGYNNLWGGPGNDRFKTIGGPGNISNIFGGSGVDRILAMGDDDRYDLANR